MKIYKFDKLLQTGKWSKYETSFCTSEKVQILGSFIKYRRILLHEASLSASTALSLGANPKYQFLIHTLL